MSQIFNWASSAREETNESPSNDQNMNEDLQAISVIEDFLTGGQSTFRAARRIAGIYEPRLKTNYRSDVAILWVNICQAARSIDSSASVRLAQLMLSIRDRPDVVTPAGDVVKHGNLVYWWDLPRWGQVFREYGYEIDPPNGDDAEWHAQAPQLLNITVFAATLMVRSDGNFDVSLQASIAMDMGVDRPYDNTRELQEEWRMYIPPAATWILIAGSKIHELCYMKELPEAVNQHSIRSHGVEERIARGDGSSGSGGFSSWQRIQRSMIDIRNMRSRLMMLWKNWTRVRLLIMSIPADFAYGSE